MPNIYQKLGVSTIINAAGSLTELGGSVMEPDAAAAMAEASQYFVYLPDLMQKLEAKVCDLLKVEAAYIAASGSAGITLSIAACMTGTDQSRIKSLPDCSGFPHTVLVPAAHRNRFDHAVHITGAEIKEFDNDLSQFEQQVSDGKVVCVYYTFSWFLQESVVPLLTAAEIAHRYSKPVVVDAANQVPPVENFTSFINDGADLVIFSGGKTIKGPQTSGLVLGKKQLIESIKLNASPNIECIGRGMKISKEELVGQIVALESYLNRDHQKDLDCWNQQLNYLKSRLETIRELRLSIKYPEGKGYQVPYLEIEWQHEMIKLTAGDLIEKLKLEPVPVYIRFNLQTEVISRVIIYAHTLKVGEEQVIADALLTQFKV